MSLGNPGQRPAVIRRTAVSGRVLDDEAVVFRDTPQTHLAERRRDDFHVCASRACHLDITAGDGRDHSPAAGLDVVAVQAVLRAVQPHRALDAERRCSFAVDRGAHRAQEPAQLDDVRLRRGVADLGAASGRGRGEQRRLGAGDGRLVEVERRARETVGRLEVRGRGRRARRAPSATSAWRCVPMVRRAGKSPPGGASRARPATGQQRRQAAAPSREASRPARRPAGRR